MKVLVGDSWNSKMDNSIRGLSKIQIRREEILFHFKSLL